MQRAPVILVTGFEPFGGSPVNPSEVLVRALAAGGSGRASVVAAVLPVVGGQEGGSARGRLDALLELHRPDACILFGEAHVRSEVSVERVAVNLRDYRIADNAGVVVTDAPVVPGAPDARFATLPLHAIVDAVRAAGVPAGHSMTAGTFLCNEVMFHALDRSSGSGVPGIAGFVHLPQLESQHRIRPCDARPITEAELLLAGRAVVDAVIDAMIDRALHA
jgi:pyroglutamyl-peptidase